MEVITSHTNADFDALASMVAAKKLYPGAKLVFPGSQEKSMRDFFVESALYAVETERLRNIDPSQITRLIVVDNRNPARLGKLAEAMHNPGLSVHIYDHHPAADGDLKGEVEMVEPVGATTTMMVELLRQKGIAITPPEATILALGLYEETGRYVLSTERDALAAAWLISQGANLNVVSDFITRELTPDQIAVLNELIQAAKSYDINGVRVVIAATATGHYVPDLAVLAHKIRDMESLDVLFLVVQMEDKTQIIGRSGLWR
jgi:tRNA nucleotidyltransferase (CCA-adding enzyme)